MAGRKSLQSRSKYWNLPVTKKSSLLSRIHIFRDVEPLKYTITEIVRTYINKYKGDSYALNLLEVVNLMSQ
jgi:hypothetical protein